MTARSPSKSVTAVALMSIAMGMTAFSCTENTPPAKSELNLSAVLPDGIDGSQPGNGAVVMSSPGALYTTGDHAAAVSPQKQGVTPAVAAAPKPVLPKEEIVIPPKEAKWTLFCTVLSGPGHIERAKLIKTRLAESTKSNKWYIVHEDDKSTLYYGFYRTIDRGTKDGDAAHADKRTISSLKTAAGDAPMQLCSFMTIDAPGPDAPLDWDLGNMVRSPDKYWSLQIAAFTADASDAEGHDRKWAAVESVKALRAQGIQAYFYHGDSISSVCVGVWPEGAVKKQEGSSAVANDPEVGVVVSNVELPVNLQSDKEGHRVQTMSPRIEVIDPTLKAMAERFPTHMVNAEELQFKVRDPKSKGTMLVSAPSFLVFVPEAKTSGAGNGQQPPVNQSQLPFMPPALLQTNQPLPPQPGVGRLRELGN